MCWTQGVSLALGAAGVATAIYKTKNKKDKNIKELTIPLLFFSGMEILQFFSYFYINQCDTTGNQLLTYLSYIHICLQPFFFNMMYLYFIPDKIQKAIKPYVYSICLLLSIFMILRLFPLEGSTICTDGQILCGTNVCSVSGNWHIAWQPPLHNLMYTGWIPSYFLAVFIMPLLYGAWKPVLVGSIAGPLLAYTSTTNVNEQPAIWCLFSVLIFIIVMDTSLQKMLKVKRWFLWKK